MKIIFWTIFLLFYLEYVTSNDTLDNLLKSVVGVYQDKQKSIENTVLLVGCNHGFLNHLHNFHCFAERLNMKFLVIAMDLKAHEYITQNTKMISYLLDRGVVGEISGDSSEFRSKNFNLITAKKKEAVHKVLILGYNVLFADTDVILLRDPFPYLLWKNVDYVHSLNVNCKSNETWTFGNGNREEGNTGFYFVRSNDRTIKLWEAAYRASLKTPKLDDQAVFWSVIRRCSDPPIHPLSRCQHYEASHSSVPALVTCPLDSCVFSSGMLSSIYEPEFTYPLLLTNLKFRNETACSIHANYIKGNELKMSILQKHGFWLATQDSGGWGGACRTLQL